MRMRTKLGLTLVLVAMLSLCVSFQGRRVLSEEAAVASTATAVSAAKTVSPTEEPAALTRLLRYPDIHGDEVVFTYAGDLWKASVSGGDAVRLTAHPGLELSAKFSPDGKWIAFTSQYDGDEQVFVIPREGGVPKQLTWYPIAGPNPPRRGFDHQVLGWTPDSKRVLFRSGRESNGVDALTHLWTVSIEGGLPVKLPLPVAGMGDLSPDGKKVVYSPLFRDFRSWKRYEGGWAQYLLIADLEKGSWTPIPTSPRTDRDPAWLGSDVCFVSDRDGTMNLYRYSTRENAIEQITKYNDWDVRWASSDGASRVVFERGGLLYCYDAATGTAPVLIPITVHHDGLAMRPGRINVAKWIESFDPAPGGKRIAFTARGDLFTVPIEKGNTRNLSNTSSSHEREAVWSPDGKWLAFLSDRTGEDQVWLMNQSGASEAIQLTDKMTSRLSDLVWSPDGSALAVHDADNQLFAILLEDIKSDTPRASEVVLVDSDDNGGPLQPNWSPDGKYLAYVINSEVNYSTIYIWDKASRWSGAVTNPMFDSFSPVWSPKGDWLFFIAQREFYPQISNIEWNFAGNRFHGLFAVSLRKEVSDLFGPQSDEVTVGDAAKEDEKSKEPEQQEKDAESKDSDEKKSAEGEKAMKPIEFEDIAARVTRVPVASENYTHLAATGDFLYYIKESAPFYGRSDGSKSTLCSFDLSKRKESVFADDVASYTLSADGAWLLYQQQGAWKLSETGATASGEPKTISTSSLFADVDPQAEWHEIFNEVWRRFRDYFYVPNMHGYDWNALGEQYRSLLPYVAHRSDLTYVLTEMISELNIGHAYIEGGDFVVPNRPGSGLAGATFALDAESNRYRISHIYRGHNEEPKYRSPLTLPGLDVAEGDYLIAIDNEELTGEDNPYRLLRNKEGQVTWTVSKSPDGSEPRTITYVPIANEQNLRYLEFVLKRMDQVAEASDGQIGYIHVPNMGGDGGYEFLKWYYPQLRKQGLIIDDRNNGGGNISPWLLMRLNQKLLGTRFGSTRTSPTTYPTIACNAHLACLINETSASDGDIFPYYFRELKLGPVIGKRSWGGVVGISSYGPLLDGGTVYVPLSATNDAQGNYVIEGYGVDPDIVVEQSPERQLLGEDPQLEKALEVLKQKIAAEPRVLPKRPVDPVKNKASVPKY
ncbi:MAG: S41 family peptidase [Planctomycetia bacterium]|nr:S41 family peptidase [Planctomycetia bacterium]